MEYCWNLGGQGKQGKIIHWFEIWTLQCRKLHVVFPSRFLRTKQIWGKKQSGGNASNKDQDRSLLLNSFGSVGILVYFLFDLLQWFCFHLKLFRCLKLLMVPCGGGTMNPLTLPMCLGSVAKFLLASACFRLLYTVLFCPGAQLRLSYLAKLVSLFPMGSHLLVPWVRWSQLFQSPGSVLYYSSSSLPSGS